MRLLVSGARIWTNKEVLNQCLDEFLYCNPDLIIVHGDCPLGADKMADEWAIRNGVLFERHPADWEKHGKPAGHIRNKEMVDTNPDFAVFFMKGESRGTSNCLSHAQKAGIPCGIYKEDERGTVEYTYS